MSGMRDVAKEAGVSLSTVSAVLGRSKKNVGEEITERVLKAAEKVGYKLPNQKKDKMIAVVIPHIASTFFANFLRGISDAAEEEGVILVIGNSDYDFKKEEQFIRLIQKQPLGGLILDTVCPVSEEKEYYEEIKNMFVDKGIPVVLAERKSINKAFSSVYIDNKKEAYTATCALIDRGCRNIAHISGKLDNPIAMARIEGYKKALENRGIVYNDELVEAGDFSPNSGYNAAKRLLIRNNRIDGLFAANDQMAIGAIKAIKSEGKAVPDNILVVGIDNLSVSSMIEPSLTTISVPTYQMGEQAVKLLMREDDRPKSVKVEGNLIVRKSTDRFTSGEWDLFGW